jgi:N-terminal domain of (some) glycogen debranching enzymes
MADTKTYILRDNHAFASLNASGDIDKKDDERGFYYTDMRYGSRLAPSVNGVAPAVIQSGVNADNTEFTARLAPGVDGGGADPTPVPKRNNARPDKNNLCRPECRNACRRTFA